MTMGNTAEIKTLNAGICPWCGATKRIELRGITLMHPPEACCLPKAVWSLSWLAVHASNRDYAEDIRRIKTQVRALLADEKDPHHALEVARRQAIEHEGHGNVYAVVQMLAAAAGGRR